jgi:hypothetical protein
MAVRLDVNFLVHGINFLVIAQGRAATRVAET